MLTGRKLGLSGAVASMVACAAVSIDAPVAGAAAPSCRGRAATIVGTAGPDGLAGTRRADVIVGRGGADHIDGHGGNDVICGDGGKDHIAGHRGSDRLHGGRGVDHAKGGPGRDVCRAEVTRGCRDGAVWRMAETSGTTMTDSSGNGNDGTTHHVTMRGKNGYRFRPLVLSKVVVPHSSTLNPGQRRFSYGARVRSSHVPASGRDYDLLRKGIGGTTGGEYKLEIVYSQGEGRAFCLVEDSDDVGASVKGTTNVTDGKVHSLTCTKTAGGLTLHVDGLPPRTETVRSGLGRISNTSPLVIGAKSPTLRGAAGDWYNGALLRARIRVGATSP
jgi:hypothetical protein